MRWLLPFPLALFTLAAPGRADLLAEKAPAELTGSKTVRLAEVRGEEILAVGKGTFAGLRVAVPARPDSDGKKKLAAGGWFLVVEADLRKAKAEAEVWVRWKDASAEWSTIDWKAIGEDPAYEAPANESGTAPVAGRVKAAALAGRALALVPLPDGAARELDLEFENRGRRLFVRAARVMRFHDAPSRAMRGKANGPFGPDQIGCGMLGFTALTEHQHTAFNLIHVRSGGPAAAAGLERGDLVVAVAGKPLGRSSLAPGWDWFEGSHEAALGRAIEGALGDRRKTVGLSFLRPSDGPTPELRTASISLPIEGAVGPRFPFSGPGADRFRADLVAWTIGHQEPNGSWSGNDAVNPAVG
ncbi:MAG: PDZ domain-containing protein, partial [Planctomycetota bacterium]